MSERTDTAQGSPAGTTTDNTTDNTTDGTVVPLRPRGQRTSAPRHPDLTRSAPRRPAPDRLWREVLGEEIRRHRTARKERLRDAADRAGISPQYLSELERGLKDPSSEMLEAVAGALGKSSFELTRSAIRAWGTTTGVGGTGGSVLMLAA